MNVVVVIGITLLSVAIGMLLVVVGELSLPFDIISCICFLIT